MRSISNRKNHRRLKWPTVGKLHEDHPSRVANRSCALSVYTISGKTSIVVSFNRCVARTSHWEELAHRSSHNGQHTHHDVCIHPSIAFLRNVYWEGQCRICNPVLHGHDVLVGQKTLWQMGLQEIVVANESNRRGMTHGPCNLHWHEESVSGRSASGCIMYRHSFFLYISMLHATFVHVQQYIALVLEFTVEPLEPGEEQTGLDNLFRWQTLGGHFWGSWAELGAHGAKMKSNGLRQPRVFEVGGHFWAPRVAQATACVRCSSFAKWGLPSRQSCPWTAVVEMESSGTRTSIDGGMSGSSCRGQSRWRLILPQMLEIVFLCSVAGSAPHIVPGIVALVVPTPSCLSSPAPKKVVVRESNLPLPNDSLSSHRRRAVPAQQLQHARREC